MDVDKLLETKKPEKKQETPQKKTKEEYDPFKREPKYCHAENSLLFELTALARHSHPTVRLWAQSLVDNKPIEYSGDPLLDYSIANFLDRIAYKEPKSEDKLRKF